MLDGSCYFYNPKRNEIIGRDNHQLDTLKDCHFSHVIGYLYAISKRYGVYVNNLRVYDKKSLNGKMPCSINLSPTISRANKS